jgi:hypothetical protein
VGAVSRAPFPVVKTSNPIENLKDTAWTIRYRLSSSRGNKMTGTRFSATSAALAFAACLALGTSARSGTKSCTIPFSGE